MASLANPEAKANAIGIGCMQHRQNEWDPMQALDDVLQRAGEVTAVFGCAMPRRKEVPGSSREEVAPAAAPLTARLPALLGPKQALEDFGSNVLLRDDNVVAQIAAVVHDRWRPGEAWHLLFWTALHGTSLHHMLRCSAGVGPCLLLLRDRTGLVFGAICSELREPEARRHSDQPAESYFYGSGQCCLFALSGKADSSAGVGTLHAFPWSGRGKQFISCPDGDRFVIGAGGRHASDVGLLLDSALSRGSSGPCETFDNPPLPLAAECAPGTALPRILCEDAVDFEVMAVEVWALDEQACLEQLPRCKRHVPIRGRGAP